MTKGNRVILSVDEIIATLKRSKLPTVLVEGDDDIIVYRRLEKLFENRMVSVMATGGRNALLKTFERLDEIPHKSSIVFVADLDMWVYTSIPIEYRSEQIIFTDGYSIENDLYRDKNWRDLLLLEEEKIYHEELKRFLKWYALSVSRNLSGTNTPIDTYPGILIDNEDKYTQLTTLEDKENYPDELFETIYKDYAKLTRGHSLMSVLLRHIAATGRRPQIHHQILLEIAASQPGPLLTRIFSHIHKFFIAPRKEKYG